MKDTVKLLKELDLIRNGKRASSAMARCGERPASRPGSSAAHGEHEAPHRPREMRRVKSEHADLGGSQRGTPTPPPQSHAPPPSHHALPPLVRPKPLHSRPESQRAPIPPAAWPRGTFAPITED